MRSAAKPVFRKVSTTLPNNEQKGNEKIGPVLMNFAFMIQSIEITYSYCISNDMQPLTIIKSS